MYKTALPVGAASDLVNQRQMMLWPSWRDGLVWVCRIKSIDTYAGFGEEVLGFYIGSLRYVRFRRLDKCCNSRPAGFDISGLGELELNGLRS